MRRGSVGGCLVRWLAKDRQEDAVGASSRERMIGRNDGRGLRGEREEREKRKQMEGIMCGEIERQEWTGR